MSKVNIELLIFLFCIVFLNLAVMIFARREKKGTRELFEWIEG